MVPQWASVSWLRTTSIDFWPFNYQERIEYSLRSLLKLTLWDYWSRRRVEKKVILLTNVCLTAVLNHILNGNSTGAVYICTEDSFPIKRLRQLITQQPQLRPDLPPALIRNRRFSDNVYIEHAADLVRLVNIPLITDNNHQKALKAGWYVSRRLCRRACLSVCPCCWSEGWSDCWWWTLWRLCFAVSFRLMRLCRGHATCWLFQIHFTAWVMNMVHL